MKKAKILLAAVLVIVVTALMLVGCNKTDKDDAGDTAGTTTTTVQTTTTTQPAGGNGSEADNALGDYTVDILGHRIAKDAEGNDILIVKYLFANVSGEEAMSFGFAIDNMAYQDGIALNTFILFDETANIDEDKQFTDIKKGASLEVEVGYKLNDLTTDVTIELQELLTFEENPKTMTQTIKITE